MTLVSMINGYGFPVIVTDRAISDPENLHQAILPTTNRTPKSPTHVVEFNVKSIIIKSILCVAFAGKVPVIEQLHTEILDFFIHRNVNPETLNEFLATLTYSDKDVSVLYALGGPEFPNNTIMVARSGDWLLDDSRENLRLLSGGSGKNTWTTHFKENVAYLDESEVSAELCRQRVLLTCISFVNQERANPENLMDGWGGGFDIVYYENGSFHRYDDLAYAFYRTDINHQHFLLPLSVIHNSYEHGNVLVRNMTADETENHLITQFNDKTPLPNVDSHCSSKDVVTCVHIYDGPKPISALVVLYWDSNPDTEPCFYTTRKDGTFGIYFTPAYFNKVKEAVRLFLS
jgi:hypothetical protein